MGQGKEWEGEEEGKKPSPSTLRVPGAPRGGGRGLLAPGIGRSPTSPKKGNERRPARRVQHTSGKKKEKKKKKRKNKKINKKKTIKKKKKKKKRKKNRIWFGLAFVALFSKRRGSNPFGKKKTNAASFAAPVDEWGGNNNKNSSVKNHGLPGNRPRDPARICGRISH